VPTLALDGCDLYYEVEGDGVPILLIHGLALDARMWDDQVAALRDVARVMRYDTRGFGRSGRDPDVTYTHAGDAWALLDHLGVDRVVLVGLSMGGRIALETALVAPERVRALVVMDAVVDGVDWDPESAKGMAAIRPALETGGPPAASEVWLAHGFFTPARRDPIVAARIESMAADYRWLDWTAHDPHGPQPTLIDKLASLTVPTTVVVGALDVPCFLEMAGVLAERIPGARKVVVPDAGHMVNLEAPEAINQVLRDTIAEVA
jgi:3-oxoadipate enol-lactonase